MTIFEKIKKNLKNNKKINTSNEISIEICGSDVEIMENLVDLTSE